MIRLDNEIRIAGIVKESIVDGPGIRMVIFAQGCNHNCPGCHNPQSHSFDDGTIITIDSILDQAKKNPLLDGLTFSGGEPFEQAGVFAMLAREARKLGLDIMTYTGYTYEYLLKNSSNNNGWANLLEETDILVDGRFEQEKKNLLLKFKGSENQRIIDLRKTKAENHIVLKDL